MLDSKSDQMCTALDSEEHWLDTCVAGSLAPAPADAMVPKGTRWEVLDSNLYGESLRACSLLGDGRNSSCAPVCHIMALAGAWLSNPGGHSTGADFLAV